MVVNLLIALLVVTISPVVLTRTATRLTKARLTPVTTRHSHSTPDLTNKLGKDAVTWRIRPQRYARVTYISAYYIFFQSQTSPRPELGTPTTPPDRLNNEQVLESLPNRHITSCRISMSIIPLQLARLRIWHTSMRIGWPWHTPVATLNLCVVACLDTCCWSCRGLMVVRESQVRSTVALAITN